MNVDTTLDAKAIALLRSLDEADPGALRQLVTLYVNDAPTQLKRIESAYRTGDIEGVRHAAHFLRSSSMAMGATALAQASHAVERLEWAEFGQAHAQQRLIALRNELPVALNALLDVIEAP